MNIFGKETLDRNKALYLGLLQERVKREGIADLIRWIEESDFFSAPASTRFHAAYVGGLCEHSLNVLVSYEKLFPQDRQDEVLLESYTLVTLVHDLCKANFYVTEKRNRKVDGQWEQYDAFTVNDQFPMGHGEKSLYIVNKFLNLTDEEAMAIRWHMGGFDESVRGGSYSQSNAYEKYPLAVKMHLSDMHASYLMEKR